MCVHAYTGCTHTGMDSTCALGYEYTSPLGSLRSNLSTDGKVTSVFEKTLSEIASLSMSVECDHAKKNTKYGMGFQFMQ